MKYNHRVPLSLVEFGEFTRFAARHLSVEEYENLTFFLSSEPESGVVIPGTGGVRKLRWAAKGKGKSGGVRVIYYYHDMGMPLMLLTGFSKSEMKDIGEEARNTYRKLMPFLVQHYSSRGKNGQKKTD